MKRWLWWLLVAVATLPGTVLLFLWVLGVDANPYAEGTPQWLWYIPLLTPLLMVGAIYGAGWLVAWLTPKGVTWTGWLRALVCLAAAGLGALVAYGVVLSVLYFGLQGINPDHLGYISGACITADGSVKSWLGWFFCLLGMALTWVVVLPPLLVGGWVIYRQQPRAMLADIRNA